MNKENLEDTLNLLAWVILVDNKVYPEEVEAFGQAVQKISHLIDPNILFTQSMAVDWFRSNCDRLRTEIRSDTSQYGVKMLMHKMQRSRYRQDVFYGMIRIAHADRHYCQKEHDLIKKAADLWGIPYNAPQSAIAS